MKRLALRHGRWFTVSPGDVDRARAWFDRHGRIGVLMGRLVPAIRTLISIPAGLTEMPFSTFLTYSLLGTFAWTALLALIGYALEDHYGQVATYLDPVSKIVLAFAALIYLYRLVTFRSDP